MNNFQKHLTQLSESETSYSIELKEIGEKVFLRKAFKIFDLRQVKSRDGVISFANHQTMGSKSVGGGDAMKLRTTIPSEILKTAIGKLEEDKYYMLQVKTDGKLQSPVFISGTTLSKVKMD